MFAMARLWILLMAFILNRSIWREDGSWSLVKGFRGIQWGAESNGQGAGCAGPIGFWAGKKKPPSNSDISDVPLPFLAFVCLCVFMGVRARKCACVCKCLVVQQIVEDIFSARNLFGAGVGFEMTRGRPEPSRSLVQISHPLFYDVGK